MDSLVGPPIPTPALAIPFALSTDDDPERIGPSPAKIWLADAGAQTVSAHTLPRSSPLFPANVVAPSPITSTSTN